MQSLGRRARRGYSLLRSLQEVCHGGGGCSLRHSMQDGAAVMLSMMNADNSRVLARGVTFVAWCFPGASFMGA